MINELESIDYELVDVLEKLGITRSRALVLVCLSKDDSVGWTSAKISDSTGLCQAVVSHALQYLIRKEYVRCAGRINVAKRMYRNLYELVVPLPDLFDDMKRNLEDYDRLINIIFQIGSV